MSEETVVWLGVALNCALLLGYIPLDWFYRRKFLRLKEECQRDLDEIHEAAALKLREEFKRLFGREPKP